MPGPQPPQTVLIVGAGEFGATAALALAEGPYKGHAHLITLCDRGVEPPAVDAASSDYNKVRLSPLLILVPDYSVRLADSRTDLLTPQIVRADYADGLYQQFAVDAMAEWRSPRWRSYFHECGVVVASASSHPQAQYVRTSHALNAESRTAQVGPFAAEDDIKQFYPAQLRTGGFAGDVAYKNCVGGWAASRDAVVEAIRLARALGVQVVTAEADALLYHPRGSSSSGSSARGAAAKGIKTRDGRTLEADFVIVACGSWTPRLLPELKTNCLPTGQTVATVKLTEAEMKEYEGMPVRRRRPLVERPSRAVLTFCLLARRSRSAWTRACASLSLSHFLTSQRGSALTLVLAQLRLPGPSLPPSRSDLLGVRLDRLLD